MNCLNCGKDIPDNATVCVDCGATVKSDFAVPVQDMPYVQNNGKSKGKKSIAIISGILIAVVAVIVVAVIMIGNISKGPMYAIYSASNKTMSEESFTIDVDVEVDGEKAEGTAYTYIDPDERVLEFYMEIENDGDEYVYAIYDEYMIVKTASNSCYKTDISEQIEEMFDTYEEGTSEEIDWEELLNSINEDAYEEASDVIDFDILNQCIVSYARELNNTSWLEENTNYSKTKKNGVTLYCFEPDLYKFSSASLECFESAFIDEDDYDEAYDVLKENKSDLKAYDLDIEIGVKSGYLVSMSMSCSDDSYTDVKYDMTFSDIGKTELPTDTMEDLLEEAE